LTRRVKHRQAARLSPRRRASFSILPTRLFVVAAPRGEVSTVFLIATYRVKKGF
jgi:hypothetical protein